MYVCICNAVTDHQVRERARSGVRSVEELTFQLGLGIGCGRCLECAARLLGDVHASEAVNRSGRIPRTQTALDGPSFSTSNLPPPLTGDER